MDKRRRRILLILSLISFSTALVAISFAIAEGLK